MKWLLIIAGILVFIVLVVMTIGYCLPVKHTAIVQVSVNATPGKVWERLADFRNYPAWRKDIKAIEVVSENEWIEINERNRKLPLKMIASEPVSRLATQINGAGLPFSGNFQFILKPDGNRTLVTITENGEIYNPVFRFISRYIMGYSATASKYGNYLQQSFL